MIHLYTARQYVKTGELWDGSPRTEPNSFRLLCTKDWMTENEFVAKGPYRVSRPKSVTSVRKHVTCPKCLDVLIPQARAEVQQMEKAYERECGRRYEETSFAPTNADL